VSTVKRFFLAALLLLFVSAAGAQVLCPVVTEGGTVRYTCDQVYTGDITFDGAVNIPGGVTDPSAIKQTTSAKTYYVRTTGNDSNDCLTTGTACLTIQAAVDLVPFAVQDATTIDIGAGTFDSFVIANKSLGATSLSITGVMANSTLATGTATGTADGGDTTYLEDTGQSWTSGDLVGRFALVDGMQRLIRSNTATRANLANYHSASISGKTYAIQDPTTLVESAAAWTFGLQIVNVRGGVYPYLNVRQIKFQNLTYSGINAEDTTYAMFNTIQIDTPQFWGLAWYRSAGTVFVEETYVTGPTWGGFLFQDAHAVSANGIVSNGGGASNNFAGASFLGVNTIDAPVITALSNGNGAGIEFSHCGNVTPRRLIADSNNTSGVLVRDGTVFSRGGYAPSITGTGNGAWGVDVRNMSGFFIGATITVTGTSGDATIDGGATTLVWATHFASDGDVVADTSNFCRIERED